MSALFDITQNTLGPGLGPGEARTDGVPGELVTITIQDQTVQEVQVILEWTPPDDEVAFFSLTANPADIKEATFTPDSNAINASGSYLIHVITDASNPARRDEAILVFGILTPNSSLLIPALNEPGNPLASLTTPDAPGAANNVPFLGPGRSVAGSPIADIDFAAWWKSMSDLILVVDGFSGGAGEVNTGVDVGVGTALVDGPNVGVQIPVRSVAGINDVGVALNGQTVEVDGIDLLDLTAVRHLVGPDFLTLEYASNPTIQLHNDSFGAEIDKRWSVQSVDGSSSLFIGAAAADGSVLGLDNSGLNLLRNAGTANVDIATLLGETVRLRSGQVTGGGTVLIQPDGTVSDEYPLLTMTSNGTFNASVEWHVGDRTPVGNITGNPGDFYVRADDGVSSTFYQHNGAAADNTSWAEIGAGTVGLQGAYNVGAAINATAAQGPVTIDVTAAQAVGPLNVLWDGNMLVETTALGNINLTSFDSANDMSIVAALSNLVLTSPLNLVTLEGADVAVTANTGGYTLTAATTAIITVSSLGAVSIASAGTEDVDITATLGDLTLTAGTGNTAELTGPEVLITGTTGQVAITNTAASGATEGFRLSAAGVASVLSANDQDVALAAQGTGVVEISSIGTGSIDVTAVGGNIDIDSQAANINVTADQELVLSAANGLLSIDQGGATKFGVTAAGAISITPASGQGLTATAAGAGSVTVQASGTGDALVNAAAGTAALQQSGASRVLVTSVGAIALLSASNQNIVLTAGGTGDVTLTAGGTGNIALVAVGDDITMDSLNLGFYGATAVAQAADPGALTDSTGGTANNTVVAISGSGDDTNINNNFADLIAKINALRALVSAAAGGVGLAA